MVSTRHQPEQQAPPVQRLRIRYAERGPARFTSHRDFGRAFERALRRAEVPMAYSSGFSPHPRISYANASPTSAATEAEYLEIGLSQVCAPDALRVALNEAFPPGMAVLEVVEAAGGSLADLLGASAWLVDLGDGVDREVLESGVARLLAAPSWLVHRMTKSGMREFDVRAAIVVLETTGESGLRMVTIQGTPLVRPDDVVQALRAAEPRLPADRPALLTRLAQGTLAAPGGPALLDPFTGAPLLPW